MHKFESLGFIYSELPAPAWGWSDSQLHNWLKGVELWKSKKSRDPELIKYLQHAFKDGFSLIFDKEPPPPHKPIPNNKSCINQAGDTLDRQEFLKKKIDALEAGNKIREIPQEEAHWVQPLHIVMAEGKEPRLVYDCSREGVGTNYYLKKVTFTMQSIDDAIRISSPCCWYNKWDIEACFLSFSIHKDFQKYLQFSILEKYYCFTHLIFGLTCAPFNNDCAMQILCCVCESLEIDLAQYVDDYLEASTSEERAKITSLVFTKVLMSLGLVNKDKKMISSSRNRISRYSD